jgi:hypothetical protein
VTYTGPERFVEREQCKRLRVKVYRNPCGHCAHRQKLGEVSVCTDFSRTFPRCLRTPGLTFEIDHETLTRES